MTPSTLWGRTASWLLGLPIALAYRIVWLMARLGSRNGRDVYRAMWDANLDLPPLTTEIKP